MKALVLKLKVFFKSLFVDVTFCTRHCKIKEQTAVYDSKIESPIRPGVYYKYYRCVRCGYGHYEV